jgi:hypothetical protein
MILSALVMCGVITAPVAEYPADDDVCGNPGRMMRIDVKVE